MRVLRLAALIATAQVALVVILFSFGYSVAHAATVYSQTDASGSYSTGTGPSGHAGIIYIGGQPYDDLGTFDIGTPIGTTPIYFTFNMQVHNNTSDSTSINGRQIYLHNITDNVDCYAYSFTSADQTLTNDNLPHAFNVITNSNPGTSQCQGGTAKHWGLTSYGVPENWNDNVTYKANAAGTHLYFVLANSPPPPSDLSTRIVPLTPNPVGQISTTTAGTSVTFSANYFYNTSIVGDPLTAINLRLNQSGTASSSVYTLTPIASYPTTSSLQTVTYTLTLPSASIWLYSWDFDATAPWGSISEFGTPTQQVFVGTNPYIAALATTTNPIGGTYTPASCSITDLTGCVQNAIAFLFWPDATAFEQFSTVSGNVRTHAPFGYVYIMLGQVGQISGSTTPTFSLSIDSTIQTAYFDPIKNGLATVLWALAAMWFLNRLRKLDL